MNNKVKYTLLGTLIGIIVVGGISLFLVANFFGQSAVDAATGYAKAKQEWKEKGIDPIDSAKNAATEFIKNELSKDSISTDSTRVN